MKNKFIKLYKLQIKTIDENPFLPEMPCLFFPAYVTKTYLRMECFKNLQENLSLCHQYEKH